MNKQNDSGNLIAAMVLCVLVIIGWDYFFLAPQREAARQAKIEQQATQPANPAAPGVPTTLGSATAAAPKPRDVVVAERGARLPFDNGKVDGSITLTGAQLDDLRLQNYRETIDPKSPAIVFLSPPRSADATFP